MEERKPFGQAFIKGWRIVFDDYEFQRGKNKGKIKCYYRKGSKYKKIILNKSDIIPLEIEKCI
jgi:hypothetical protein